MTRATSFRFIDRLAHVRFRFVGDFVASVNQSSRVSKKDRAGVFLAEVEEVFSACCSAAGSPYCSSTIFEIRPSRPSSRPSVDGLLVAGPRLDVSIRHQTAQRLS